MICKTHFMGAFFIVDLPELWIYGVDLMVIGCRYEIVNNLLLTTYDLRLIS